MKLLRKNIYLSLGIGLLGLNLLIIIGVILFAAIIAGLWFLNHYKIDFDSINPFKSGASGRYKLLAQIFYQYKHSSSKEWLNWILSQDTKMKEEAYLLLKLHLEDLPQKWSAVTPEAVMAIIGFEKQETFNVLQRFVYELESQWGKYKIVPDCYEKAVTALVQVKPRVIEDILYEFYEDTMSNNAPWQDQKKKVLIQAFMKSEDKKILVDAVKNVLLHEKEKFYIKNFVLTSLAALDDETKRSLSKKTIQEFIDSSEHDISMDTKSVVNKLLREYVLMDCEEEDWDFLFDSFFRANVNVKHDFLEAFKTAVSSPKVQIPNKFLFKMLNLSDPGVMSALGQRQNLSDKEQILIEEPEVVESFLDERKLSVMQFSQALFIPSSVKKSNKQLRSMLHDSDDDDSNKIQGFKGSNYINGLVIGGDDEHEKLYQIRHLAHQQGHSFVYYDISSSDLKSAYDTLSLRLNEAQRPYTLFLKNIRSLLVANQKDQYKISNFFNMIKNYLMGSSRDCLVATVPDILDPQSEEGLVKPMLRKSFFPKLTNLSKHSPEKE